MSTMRNQSSAGDPAILSIGHLAPWFRAVLDDAALGKSVTLMARTGGGYLMRPSKGEDAPWDMPLETTLVLDHGTMQGFELVQFAPDGTRDPSLPWFDDEDVMFGRSSGAPLAKLMSEFMIGLSNLQEDPRNSVLFNMAYLALRRLQLDGNEPPTESLTELRNAAMEFTYRGASEDRFGQALHVLQSWRPDLSPALEF